jgi:hypothetical protein
MDFQTAQEHLKAEANHLKKQFAPDSSPVYNTVHELRLKLATPLMISQFKTNIPVPGLPNLDGILQYAAFYTCARNAAQQHPELATHYLWQVNEALHGRNWIPFPVPLGEVPIQHAGVGQARSLYDCSVGLPVDATTGRVCYPIGSEFWDDQGEKLERVVDTIPLRRRLVEPRLAHKPIHLTDKLDTSRGAHKALDNRMYNSALTEYHFYFRGDPFWVRQLLETLRQDGVGIGKKSSLGYGQIQEVTPPTSSQPADQLATFGHWLSPGQKRALGVELDTPAIALIKNVPTDELFRRCTPPPATDNQRLFASANKRLFASASIRVLSLVPALAGYAPPHWLKRNQTAVARVGSLLLGA